MTKKISEKKSRILINITKKITYKKSPEIS